MELRVSITRYSSVNLVYFFFCFYFAFWPGLRSPSTWLSLDVAPLATETSPTLWLPLSSSQSKVVCCKPVPSGCLLYSLLVYFDMTHFSSIALRLAAAYNGRARRMVTRSDYKKIRRMLERGPAAYCGPAGLPWEPRTADQIAMREYIPPR